MSNTVYMYLDEAGNFDFSPKGSKYFIMTCVIMQRPFSHISDLSSLKYDCIEEGLDDDIKSHKFHASEDTQATRDKVFEVLSNHLENMQVFSVIIRKNRTNPVIRDRGILYSKVFEWLVSYAAGRIKPVEKDLLVVVTDTIPVQKKREDVRAALKKQMAQLSNEYGVPYRLYHHTSESDINLQVADYCCWAIQRKWELDDDRSYKIIEKAIIGEGDLFKKGSTEYYTFEE